MTNINRRKFIMIFGTVSIGSISQFNKDVDALEINVNRFENNKKVSLQNVHSVAIKIKEGQIIANNIDYTKDAKLSIYADVEGNDIGKISSRTVEIKRSGTDLTGEKIKINNSDLFKIDRYDPQKSSIDINLEFNIEHPSIKKTIIEETTFRLDLTVAGELVSHQFNDYKKFGRIDNKTRSDVKTISGTNLRILEEDNDLGKIKSLIGGGSVSNSSSYSIPSAVIDTKNIEYNYSTERGYNITTNKESKATSIVGEDLHVLKSMSGFEQVKLLIGGGSVSNSSSYSIPSAVIDTKNIEYNYSTERGYNITTNKEPDATSFK